MNTSGGYIPTTLGCNAKMVMPKREQLTSTMACFYSTTKQHEQIIH